MARPEAHPHTCSFHLLQQSSRSRHSIRRLLRRSIHYTIHGLHQVNFLQLPTNYCESTGSMDSVSLHLQACSSIVSTNYMYFQSTGSMDSEWLHPQTGSSTVSTSCTLNLVQVAAKNLNTIVAMKRHDESVVSRINNGGMM